ncbi:MAG: hypothetical protein WC205_11300 [Opitutaceae bacterium]|jgi:hypothetical protein
MKTRAHSSPFSSRRGAVLIVALLLAGGLAIAIGSYISITSNNLKLSNRAFYNNAAINLAETGLEEALWSINRNLEGNSAAWDDWKKDGTEAYRPFGPFDLGQNIQGYANVYVSNTTSSGTAPMVVAKAYITPQGQGTIEKWVSVTLRKRSKFSNGLVAKKSITFRGNNASVDSWNSEAGGSVVPYSASVRKDNGSVGSISVSVDSVLVQNADVWGYVSTGGDDPTDNVGTNGSILGTDSAAKDSSTWTKKNVDPSRVATDFTSSLDPVSAPATSYALGAINNAITLPRGTDSPNPDDGIYYYSTTGVSLVNKTITILSEKKVVLVSSGDIKVGGGSGLIQINKKATFEIYASGDVSISGKGIANGVPAGTELTALEAQQPINFQIWGTSSTSQNIDVKGNGAFSGIIYAPNASVFVNGNGDVLGSVIGNDVTMVGNAAFHYDESLADFGGSSPFGISKWSELTTSAQRSDYSSKLGF